MSSIHYKFKATLEYKTLTFNGLHISVNDLKKEICEKENIKAESFDLLLTNAHTKRQYTTDEFIPRNSSVIVQRTPRDNAAKLPKVQDSTNSGVVSKGAVMDGTFASHMESEQFDQLSEEDRIAHIKEVSAFKYQPSNFQKKSSSILWGPPPPTYQCNRCSQSGHWYKNCPMLNTRRTTGITMDELMETTADDPLAMLHPSGKFVVPIMHWKARQQKKTELSRAPEPDNRVIPPELKCPLCSQLLRDAVLTTCCGDSFCAECVQQRLLESVNAKCPGANCIQTSISADKIVPNLKVRQAVEAFKKAAPSAQSATCSTQQSPVIQQHSADTAALAEEPPKVQAQPVPRVRIGLGSRLQPTQPLTASPQQNAVHPQQHQQQPQHTSSPPALQGVEVNNLATAVQQATRPPPLPQQQQQPQPQPLPLHPQPQPMVGGVVLAPGPPPIEPPKMPTTATISLVAPPAVTGMLLPVGGVLSVNVHQPPPGYTPVATSAPPTVAIASPPKTTANTDSRGVAAMLQSMNAPPPPIILQQPPLQPPPPGLSAATTFPSVPAPPPVRDAWDEFIERKEKVYPYVYEAVGYGIQRNIAAALRNAYNCLLEEEKQCCMLADRSKQEQGESVLEDPFAHDRLFVATQASRRRHSSPSESYSSSESSSEPSSDSRSRSRSWSRERTRRERRHESRERRHKRRVESRSPPRLYSGSSSRYHRDSGPSHNIYQHPPPAPLSASPSSFPHHRIPPLISYPPPSFLPVPGASLSSFQPLPANMPSSGDHRGGRGYVDERTQRRRSPRVPEMDRRMARGGVAREREGERRERPRVDEGRRRPRDNEDRSARIEERPSKNRQREVNERDQRRNKYREGTSRRRREQTETKVAEAPAAAQPEKRSKKEVRTSGEPAKGRPGRGASVTGVKEDDVVKRRDEALAEEEEAVKKEVAVEKENEALGNEELGNGSEILVEKEDENETIDVGGVETKEPEIGVETSLVEGTEGSVSGADAENEDGTEAVAESGEGDRGEKKKKKKKKKKHKKEGRHEGDRERKRHRKQNKEEFVGEERDEHKKSKRHKRSREEKEKHKEEKERRREEKKRKKECHEEGADANDVDMNTAIETGAQSHPLQGAELSNKETEYVKGSGCLAEVLHCTGKQVIQRGGAVVSEESGEKAKLREGAEKEQRREEYEVSEGGRKSGKTEDGRIKGLKRAREEKSAEEGAEEKKSRVGGIYEKRNVEKKTVEGEHERKRDLKREHCGTIESKKRDEKHFKAEENPSRLERSTHRIDSGSGHLQGIKRRAEGGDESKERKEARPRRDDEDIRGKEARNELRRDMLFESNAEPNSKDRHFDKRKAEIEHEETKKIRESTANSSKRSEEKHREGRRKERERVDKEKEKGKRAKREEETTATVENRDESNKVKSVNKEETAKKSASRGEHDDSKSSGKDKKIDEIKVSVESELVGERKVGASVSGDSHKDKPNITVELKYGGEKKVTRENVFENSVPQFNARQKIKMILLSESERFAADRAKKRNAE